MKNHTARILAPGILSLTALSTVLTIAQTSCAQAQAPAAPAGLDSLDERDVYVNLINHKLTDLAKMDMEAHKVPKPEQEQMFALASLEQLKTDRTLTAAQRRALAVSAASGLQLIMAKSTDYQLLNNDANDLVRFGINQTVDQLDYFGDNPDAQRQLQPVAECAKALYAKASTLLGAKLDEMDRQITNANAEKIQTQERGLADALSLINYSNNMTSYALCISYPKGDPKRKEIATAAITYLATLDDPGTGVQPDVRIAMGKLLLATGDFAGAHKMLDAVAAGKDITPKPTELDQNTSRFFGVVADLDAGDFAKADSGQQNLESWQAANLHLANDPGTANAIAAAMGMLKFRIDSARADAAGRATPAGKKFNDAAITALVTLLQSQKNNRTLEDLVFDQIRGRIGANPDYKSLDTLALLALRAQGFNDYDGRATKPVDPVAMEKAINACRELAARVGQPGVDKALAQTSALFMGVAYQFALNKDIEAANAYIDFLTNFKAPLTADSDQQEAFNNCTAILGDLKKKQEAKQTTADDDDKINALFDRYLPLVLGPPYNQTKLAFLYGKTLYEQHKWGEAAKYLAMVAPDSGSRPSATFMRMVALGESMNDPADKPTPEQRKALAADTIKTAAEVQKSSLDAANAKGVTADDRKLYLQRAIVSAQVAASLERSEMKDPKAALAAIDQMEKYAGDLGDPEQQQKYHIDALQMRCANYLSDNDTADAVKTVQELLKLDPKAGQQLVINVNATVETDLTAATANHDQAQIKSLTVARSELTGEIVNIVAESADPKLRENLPAYRLYDAYAKRQAAELLDDGPQRTAALQGALAQYDVILKDYKPLAEPNAAKVVTLTAQLKKAPPDQQAAIQAQIDALNEAAANNEKAEIGAGLASFDLGDYQRAMDMIGPLIAQRHTGSPRTADGKDNPDYWEAFYKYWQSSWNVGNAKKDAALMANTRRQVANEYTLNSKTFGGVRWHDQCMALLKQVKPDAVKPEPVKPGA